MGGKEEGAVNKNLHMKVPTVPHREGSESFYGQNYRGATTT